MCKYGIHSSMNSNIKRILTVAQASVNNEVVRYVNAVIEYLEKSISKEKTSRESDISLLREQIENNKAAQAIINADVESRLTDGNPNT